MEGLTKLLEVALSGAAVNIIVTRGAIFRKLRGWLDRRNQFLGDLVHCPLCFGTWTGLLLAWILGLRLFGGPVLVDWFFSGLAATCLIVPFSFIIYASMHRILITEDDIEENDEDDQ